MIDERFQTTEGLVDVAREAGFVCSPDGPNGYYVISGTSDNLRRFYQKTAGAVILQWMAEDAQRLGLYDDVKV